MREDDEPVLVLVPHIKNKSLELSMCTCRTSRRMALKRFRSQFGSRAISVQVNIVAVSDHVFHRFPFDLLEPFVDETYLARIALSCHLLWIYYVTRRGPTIRLTLYLEPLPVV